MKTAILALALALVASADDTRIPLSESAALKLENAALRLRILKTEEQQIQQAAQVAFEAECSKAKIPLAECRLDQAKSAIMRVAPPAKPEPAKPEPAKPKPEAAKPEVTK